jgi:predicted RNA-binding protein with PIN domain
MPYLIDGHNLIPRIPGLALDQIDDEQQLVELLQDFCRRSRKQVEVYFDNAPPGQPPARSLGSVVARFVRQGSTADQAIRAKLSRLGGSARNWTVVSSDREVQTAARAARARVLPSEEFAALMLESEIKPARQSGPRPEDLSPDELADWMKLFGVDEGEDPPDSP